MALISVVIPTTATTNGKYSFNRWYSIIWIVIATSSTTMLETISFGLPANTNSSRNEQWKFKINFYLVNFCSLNTACNNTSKCIVNNDIQLTIVRL